MAITYVGGTSGAGTGATYSVSLSGTLTGGSGTSPLANDVVVVMTAFSQNTTAQAPTVSGNSSGAYTAAGTASHANDTYDVEFGTFYIKMGATVDTSLTIGRRSSAVYGGGTVVMVFRGVNNTTALDATGTPVTATNGSRFNPPSITPTTSGAYLIYGGAGSQVAASGVAPTDSNSSTYHVAIKGDGTTADIGIGMGAKAWTSGAFDAAANTNLATTTACAWAAQAIALRPTLAPTVTTQAVSNVNDTTATGNGNITSNGGGVITEKGVCYMTGTSGDPTTANSKFYDNTDSTGAYTESMTGLSPNTNYRVRAYAINSTGTGYGTTVQLTTNAPAPPTVALNTPSDAATITDTTPTVAFTGTSSSSYDLEYNIQIDTTDTFSSRFVSGSTTVKDLASGDNQVDAICSDDNYVYVATYNTFPPKLVRISKSDFTTTSTLTMTGYSYPVAIVNDASYIYVLMEGPSAVIARVNKSDFSTITSKTLVTGTDTANSMTDDATYIYVGEYSAPAVVHRVAKSDFTTTVTKTLATGENSAISMKNDATYIYVGLDVAPAKIVRILKSDFNTTVTKTLATNENYARSITNDATYVYVGIYTTPAKVFRILISDFSTTVTKTLETGENNVRSITNDANYVYVGTYTTPSKITRISKSDFSTAFTRTLASGENSVRALDIDSSYIYAGLDLSPAKIVRINNNSLISKFSVTDYSEFTDVTDGSDPHPYASGDQISYTVQSADILLSGIYYWRAAAIDPTGGNVYGSWPTARSFYVATSTSSGQYGADRVTAIAIGAAAGTAGYTTNLYQESLVYSPDTTLSFVPKIENMQLGTSFNNTATTTGTSMYFKSNDLPTMRRGAILTYDSINKRYISCGGYNGTIRFNDLWALSYYGDNSRPRWRKLAPSGTPPAVANMGASTQLNKNGKSWLIYWGGSLTSGQSNSMYIADCTTPGSETWTTPTQTNAPSTRSYLNQHMVSVSTGTNTYDVYLFGGWGAARYNNLSRCSFDLSGSVPTAITWTTVTADGAAGSPSRRQSAILVHDSANSRIVLFSGYDGTSYLADLWSFDIGTTTWSQLSPTGTAPSVREAANGAYDVTNQRMVIFGGWSDGTLANNLNDIVSISLVSGSESFTTIRANDTTNNSFQRASNGAACLDTDKRMIVQFFQGGTDLTTKYGYAFDLDEGLTSNATMYGLNVVDTFRARDAPAYCVDTTRSVGVLMGGYGNMNDDTTIANGDHMNEMWSYDYSTNALRYVSAGALGKYYAEGSQACYDSVNDRIIIFGGLTALGQVTNDVWELKPDAFGNYKARRMLPTGTKPGSRWLSVIAFDAARNRVVIWSGSNSSGSLIANTDMWILDLSSGDGAWSSASPTGTPPPAMWQPMYAYKASNNRLYIFSGCTNTGGTTYSTSTYYLDLTNAIPAWVQPTTTSTVGVRGGVMAFDTTNNYLIAFGGYNGTASNNTLSFLDLANDTNNWITVSPGGTIPAARRSAAAFFMGGKFYVVAGRSDSTAWFSDVQELTPNYTTPSSSTWVNKSPAEYQPMSTATTGLTNNANYHWQSWATIASVDTAMSSFGGNAESAIDFTIGTVSGGSTGIKVYNGATWAYKPVKVYNGATWVAKPVKVWDGSSWVTKG